jgi:hypothetical protein
MVKTMSKVANWITNHRLMVELIILVIVIAPGYAIMRMQADADRELVECLTEWTDASTERSVALSDASADRNLALDLLIRTVPLSDRDLFNKRLDEYIEASDAFAEASSQNPIPQAPRFMC